MNGLAGYSRGDDRKRSFAKNCGSTRYIGRQGTKRVSKAVLISAILSLMLKTPANPGGLPLEEFDKLRAAVLADRSQFF
jgi:non-heme chloroperoxidase